MAQAPARSGERRSPIGDMYMEKLVENPRHIEFQILADQHGNVEVLGERECSIQRRHQKLIEESPSPAMTPELRQTHIASAAEGAAGDRLHQRGHRGISDGCSTATCIFIEVNARIQVEHPVTEMVTGIDLVKSQIRIAAGESLRGDPAVRAGSPCAATRSNAASTPNTRRPSPLRPGRITGLESAGRRGRARGYGRLSPTA